MIATIASRTPGRGSAAIWIWPLSLLVAMPQVLAGTALATHPLDPPGADEVERGRVLFAREWLPDDPRSHGGDGLGPVFNDSSCVACHNLGGVGGGGPNNKNVDVLSAIETPAQSGVPRSKREFLKFTARAIVKGREIPDKAEAEKKDAEAGKETSREELIKFHAGFGAARSVVVHKFGTDPTYRAWRARTLAGGTTVRPERDISLLSSPNLRAQAEIAEHQAATQFGNFGGRMMDGGEIPGFSFTRSQRNTSSLFGAGLIDSIPDSALEAAAKVRFDRFPEVQGRVSRQKDGRIGRFGWKGQTPSLNDFVLTACAVELGLDVPGHAQGGIPQAPNYRPPGLDLTKEDCDALVAFVRSLPAPARVEPSDPGEAKALKVGRETFESIGCASCHSPKLGDVEGLFSDLLLHDMGQELGDVGSYGVFVPDSPDSPQEKGKPKPDTGPLAGATRLEWRTPPLWGFRDSGPYLHDGRAETLEQAVALHGGQGAASAHKFFELKPKQRGQVEAFLKSLTAPTPVALAAHRKG